MWWSAVLLMGSAAAAQQSQAPAAQRFPYPGETGSSSAPSTSSAPSAPEPQKQAPPATGEGSDAAKKFPFPGEPGSGDTGGLKDAGSSGESSSSSAADGASSSSSSAGELPPSPDDVNSDTPPPPKRNLHKKPEPPPKDVAAQEAEDLSVAGFYMNDKNWRGAYTRAQHAVLLSADDPDAHLALAEAARKLGKLDEAEKEYHRTLQLDPVPKSRKAAERALKEMSGG